MIKHWRTVHSEEEGNPQFRFQVVKYCRSALERQVGEATRITLRGSCLNSKAGYNRSGVTRLTLRPEDAPQKKTRVEGYPSRLERVEKEGMEIMSRRAEERAEKNNRNSRKRGGEEDLNKRNKKKMRKLKHAVVDEDWGLESDELAELERK